MIRPDGVLMVKKTILPLHGIQVEYRLCKRDSMLFVWNTDDRLVPPNEVKFVAIDSELAPASGQFALGPYRFRVVERDMLSGMMICAVDNWFAPIRIGLYRSTRWLDGIYRRLIITAYVWGLATYGEWAMPTWRDLKVVQWIIKRKSK